MLARCLTVVVLLLIPSWEPQEESPRPSEHLLDGQGPATEHRLIEQHV